MERNQFAPSENISLNFTISSKIPSNSWVGIIPANIQHGSSSLNDQHDVQYQYLQGRTKGTLTFKPLKPGKWSARINANDSELHSISFEVSQTHVPEGQNKPELLLTRKQYAPSENIVVEFKAPKVYPSKAWIGIVPANIQHGSRQINDQHDVQYQYLQGRTKEKLTFRPLKPGKWSLRMNAFDSETASIDFEVAETHVPEGQNKPELLLTRKQYTPSENIVVEFKAPKVYPSKAWIGIVPANIQHGSRQINDQHDVQYQYLQGRTKGKLTFRPLKPGKWSLRMNAFDSETASIDFEVAETLAPSATLEDLSQAVKQNKEAAPNITLKDNQTNSVILETKINEINTDEAIVAKDTPKNNDEEKTKESKKNSIAKKEDASEVTDITPAPLPNWMKVFPSLEIPEETKNPESLDLRDLTRAEYAGIVSQAKETIAEVLGPMSEKQQAAYDKSWLPMFSYPAPECIDYLEKIIPIAEQTLSLRMGMIEAIKTTSEMWEIAGYVEVYNPQEAQEIMLQIRDRTIAIQSIKISLDKSLKKLDALGEPPNPEALQEAAQAKHRRAMRSLESLLYGSQSIDGYYELIKQVDVSIHPETGKPVYIAQHNVKGIHTLSIKALKTGFSDLVLFSELSYNESTDDSGGLGALFDDMFEAESWTCWQAEQTADGWVNYSYDPEDGMIDVTYYRPFYDEMEVDNYCIYEGEITASRKIYHRAPLMKGTKLFEDGETEESIMKMIHSHKNDLIESANYFKKGKNRFPEYSSQIPELCNPEQLYWVLKDLKITPNPTPDKKEYEGDYFYQELNSFNYSNNSLSASWVDVEVLSEFSNQSPDLDIRSTEDQVDAIGNIIPAGTVIGQYVPDPDSEEDHTQITYKEKRKSFSKSIYWEPAPALMADGAFWTLNPRLDGKDLLFYLGNSDNPFAILGFKYKMVILDYPVHCDVSVSDEEMGRIESRIVSEKESSEYPLCLSLRSSRIQDSEYKIPLELSNSVGSMRLEYIYEQKILDENEAGQMASQIEGTMVSTSYSELTQKRLQNQEDLRSSEALITEASDLQKDRIAFHQANISYAKKNVQGLKRKFKQLEKIIQSGEAKKADINAYNELQFRIACEQSNMIDETDKLRAEKTGVYTRTRTPFEDLCRANMIQKCEISVQRSDRAARERKKAEYQISKIKDSVQKRKAQEILYGISSRGKSLDPNEYQKLNSALSNIRDGEFLAESAKIDNEIAWANAQVEALENIKTGAEVGLALTSLGGGSIYVNIAYQTGCGYIEGGYKEALKRGISTYSDAADIMITGYDGWKNGGFWGAVEGASWSILMNKGPEVAMGRLKFSKGFDGGYRPIDVDTPKTKSSSSSTKVNAPDGSRISKRGAEAIQGGKMKQELEHGRALVNDYWDDYKLFKNAEIKGDMDPAEFRKLKTRVRQKAAAIAHSMPAKSYLKYDVPPRVGAAYTEVHSEILGDAMSSWKLEMKQLGYSDQQLKQIRNMSSMDAGMDSDLGLNQSRSRIGTPNPEDLAKVKSGEMKMDDVRYSGLTKNGKQLSIGQWQKDANRVLAANYKHVTGGYNAHQSFVEVTTSVHVESYRDKQWLMLPQTGAHANVAKVQKAQDQIFGNLKQTHIDHDLNITSKKSEIMFKEHKELRPLGSMMESCRGSAKDLNTKYIPLVESKIREMKRLPKNQVTPDVQARLKELSDTKKYLQECSECFTNIGQGKTHPGRWMNDFKMVTGGEDPLAVSRRLAHMTKMAAK